MWERGSWRGSGRGVRGLAPRTRRGCRAEVCTEEAWATQHLCQLTVQWRQTVSTLQTPAESLWRPQVPQGGCLGHRSEPRK